MSELHCNYNTRLAHKADPWQRDSRFAGRKRESRKRGKLGGIAVGSGTGATRYQSSGHLHHAQDDDAGTDGQRGGATVGPTTT
jgi:hypothetical protein